MRKTEHPILFSGQMVRAILDGKKTMTRRIVSDRNSAIDNENFVDIDIEQAAIHNGMSVHGYNGFFLKAPHKTRETGHRIYPRYEVGDTLWVRETFAYPNDQVTIYRVMTQLRHRRFVKTTG